MLARPTLLSKHAANAPRSSSVIPQLPNPTVLRHERTCTKHANTAWKRVLVANSSVSQVPRVSHAFLRQQCCSLLPLSCTNWCIEGNVGKLPTQNPRVRVAWAARVCLFSLWDQKRLKLWTAADVFFLGILIVSALARPPFYRNLAAISACFLDSHLKPNPGTLVLRIFEVQAVGCTLSKCHTRAGGWTDRTFTGMNSAKQGRVFNM